MIKKLVGLGLASVAAMLFASTASAQGVTKDEILIGGFGPITGPAAYIGLGGRDGLAMAIKEINAAGGVNGRKFRLIFEDDGHSPTRALGAVKKLIDQPVIRSTPNNRLKSVQSEVAARKDIFEALCPCWV